ncbi:glycosyltransferase involved in cell wall biosynthesis [Novosphingobium sp. PhB165]|uniref:glycosyltransferase family 4 protein n=1 Tax=Novosphingobium sp. PhB165 TaxID=2485105 RepID=UPI0010D224DA|nr:glycosyltransferase family 4 protein [Novosphingobium sp. PhB165]TCM21360.1 glycosyltransferase involved in cell wall biosynthesis [Novosphingobium sp. PhB165]
MQNLEPLHVAILASGLGAGGAEQVIAQLARHWCAAEHRVSVIAFDRPGDAVYHALPAATGLHRLGGRAGTWGVLGRVFALRRVLAAERPAVLVSFLTKNNLIAALATLGTGTRLVCAERNNPERQDAHPLWNRALDLLYRRADAIVCQTDAVRRCFPAAVRRKLVTIPNPIPTPDVFPTADDTRRICAVGRLTHQKGFDVLLGAFALIAPRFPGWSLTIHGEGPDRAALEAAVAELGLSGRVELPGLSPVPRGWIAECDVFVLSSRYEGFPNVLGEAMAAGLPVIAANCDFGPADMVETGKTGVLVASEDTEALADALAEMIENRAARERMGPAAAAAMARFAPERVLARWDQLLARVLATGRRPASAPPAVRSPTREAGAPR